MYIVCEDMYMYSYIYSTIAYYGMGVALNLNVTINDVNNNY